MILKFMFGKITMQESEIKEPTPKFTKSEVQSQET